MKRFAILGLTVFLLASPSYSASKTCVSSLTRELNEFQGDSSFIMRKGSIDALKILDNIRFFSLEVTHPYHPIQFNPFSKVISYDITTDGDTSFQLRNFTFDFAVEWRNNSLNPLQPNWLLGSRGILRIRPKSGATQGISLHRIGFQKLDANRRYEVFRGLLILPNSARYSLEFRVLQQNQFEQTHTPRGWQYSGPAALILTDVEISDRRPDESNQTASLIRAP